MVSRIYSNADLNRLVGKFNAKGFKFTVAFSFENPLYLVGENKGLWDIAFYEDRLWRSTRVFNCIKDPTPQWFRFSLQEREGL